MTDRDVLLRAADVIIERGWCQGQNEDDEGRVCLLGALLIAVGGRTTEIPTPTPDYYVRAWRLSGHVARLAGSSGRIAFNDDPNREISDIVTALERAADAEVAA